MSFKLVLSTRHYLYTTRKRCLKSLSSNETMPLSERISTSDIYVNKLHRNGAVKQKYNELLQRFKTEHLKE